MGRARGRVRIEIERAAAAVTMTVMAVVVAVAAGAPAALAQDVCDTTVVDPDGLLDAVEVTLLEVVAADLADAGVDPHLWLLAETDGGIDRWYADTEAACPSWQGPAGRADDLLVLAVSLGDRETATYYGEDLVSLLDSRYLDVHDAMIGDLQAGRYGAALALGADRYLQLLLDRPSVQVPPPAPAPPPPSPVTPTAPLAEVTPDEASAEERTDDGDADGDSGWLALAGLLGVGALGVGGTAGVRRQRDVRRHQRGFERRRADVRQAYVDLDDAWAGTADRALLARGSLATSDRVALLLEAERQQAVGTVDAATAAYVSLAERPDPSGWSAEPYADAQAAWDDVGGLIDTATIEVAEVDQVLTDVEDGERTRQEQAAAFDRDHAAAMDAISAAAGRGFATAALTAALDEASRARTLSTAAADEGRLGEALDQMSRAMTLVAETHATAEALPQRQQELSTQQVQLRARADAADATVAEVQRLVETMRTSFAPAVVDPVIDNDELAASLLRDARADLDRAATAVGMDAQRFDEAAETLGRTTERLDGLDRILDGTRQVRDDVDAATAGWEEAEAEAARSIEDATRFATHNQRDVATEHLPALDRATGILEEARSLFRSPLPDPLASMHRLQEVDRAADSVLARARDEKAARDRARARAGSMITSAFAEVSRAESRIGFGLFGWSSRSKESLTAAREQLARARQQLADHPERAESIALSAERTATSILAEAQRRDQRRSNDGGGLGGSWGGGGGGGRSGGGGGGSSSFGGGGGGSSSFGGGGGGSSKW